MADVNAEAAQTWSEMRSQYEGRLHEELACPDDTRAFDAPTSFVDEHDIIVLVGNLGEDGDEDAPEVVDSVVRAAIGKGVVKSARACGKGGIAACVARCCKEGGIGCFIIGEQDAVIFEESFAEVPGRVVVSVASRDVEDFADMLDDVDASYVALGQVGGDRIVLAGMDVAVRVDLPVSAL